VPFGSVGELYIGGDGLALGYLNREDLTSERFVLDPYRGKGQMYQTGDLARFTSNGDIECLGRNDGQVKVRGYRIELGEIEAVLDEQDIINESVVLVREDRPGDIRLVAYIIIKDKDGVDQFKLREQLGQKLPAYMLPSNYIILDSFPQTLNGKIDKKSLPPLNFENKENLPKVNIPEQKRTNNDSSELEERFAVLWKNILGVNTYRESDNFFEVGGHSLLSVELFSKISKEFNVELPLSKLVTHATFKEIFDLISGDTQTRKESTIPNEGINIPAICSSLVAIKNTGSDTPVFCFHGVGGNVLNYMRLGPASGNHPVIGVQSQGVDGRSVPLKSISEMVTKYVDELRLVQPHGPYILSGASMGGLIALEVARELQDQGEKIKGLILLDTFGPDLNIKNYSSKDNWFASKWGVLKWKLKKSWVQVKTALLTLAGLPIPHDIRYFNIETINYQALWSHKVKSYTGDIIIIRAPLSEEGWYSDPKMGWERTINGVIITHIIDGDHEYFVESKDLPSAYKNVLNSL